MLYVLDAEFAEVSLGPAALVLGAEGVAVCAPAKTAAKQTRQAEAKQRGTRIGEC